MKLDIIDHTLRINVHTYIIFIIYYKHGIIWPGSLKGEVCSISKCKYEKNISEAK